MPEQDPERPCVVMTQEFARDRFDALLRYTETTDIFVVPSTGLPGPGGAPPVAAVAMSWERYKALVEAVKAPPSEKV